MLDLLYVQRPTGRPSRWAEETIHCDGFTRRRRFFYHTDFPTLVFPPHLLSTATTGSCVFLLSIPLHGLGRLEFGRPRPLWAVQGQEHYRVGWASGQLALDWMDIGMLGELRSDSSGQETIPLLSSRSITPRGKTTSVMDETQEYTPLATHSCLHGVLQMHARLFNQRIRAAVTYTQLRPP